MNSIEAANQLMQMRLNEQHWRNQMEIEKSVCKEQMLNNERLDFAVKKMQLQEFQKEMKKTNHDEIVFGSQGELEMLTKNPLIPDSKYKIANFQFADIFKLQSSSGEDGFYKLKLIINSKEVEIFLAEEKIGKADYFMKKLTEAGGEIYINRRSERENFLFAFWAKLASLCEKTIIVPANIGWIKLAEGHYKFIEEGTLLWHEMVKKSK